MSKIICEVCGTAFAETSTQCPICGYVHDGEGLLVDVSAEETETTSTYSYVKGGRFSKSNVRKLNKGEEISTTPLSKKNLDEQDTTGEKKTKQKNGAEKGLVITIVVLILAIIAVIGYIAVRFVVPALSKATEPSLDAQPDAIVEQVDLSCKEIILDTNSLVFTAHAQQQKLHVSVLPADTTDTVSFLSKDDSVATVDGNGVVTATGRGETAIVVICGDVQVECSVLCDYIPEEAMDFRLNRKQITFDVEGAGWLLYSGDIPVEDIIWTSDDPAVATVEEGRITAVGEGYTRIHGEYLGNKQSCEVVCLFENSDEGQEGSANVGEEGSQSGTQSGNQSENQTENQNGGNYRLDNLYSSYDTEVTLRVGEWFPLRLVDENGNYMDAQWSVENGNVCKVNGGDVTALASGQTYIIATYNGQQYRCLVLVN